MRACARACMRVYVGGGGRIHYSQGLLGLVDSALSVDQSIDTIVIVGGCLIVSIMSFALLRSRPDVFLSFLCQLLELPLTKYLAC